MSPLVVEVEVLALRLALGAHHLSDGWPVPAVLYQPCGKKETLYMRRDQVKVTLLSSQRLL